jgi:hypothetical protein
LSSKIGWLGKPRCFFIVIFYSYSRSNKKITASQIQTKVVVQFI